MLFRSIEQIMRKLKLPLSSIQSVCISCNNTMQHILLGLDGKGLEQFPFQPAATTFQPKHYHQSLVTLIPSISAFIGGDIVSGLYYLSTKDKTAPYLFLDLGTNAEIALVLKDRILCTSTAAGPGSYQHHSKEVSKFLYCEPFHVNTE